MLLEKLEDCPVCGSTLTQAEYDFQRHAKHWDALSVKPADGSVNKLKAGTPKPAETLEGDGGLEPPTR